MEAAKSTVKKFMSSSGHHETTVHEKVAPAVEQENIIKEQHERQTTAVDKEVHQDHYHTTVQPVKHNEVLSEQHHHNVVPTEHRSYEHDNADEVQRKLKAEQSQFRNEQTRTEGQRTSTAEPTVAGEHVHHHVHETIQPVVQKQTVEPHVVHTTVPVHEVHHNAAKHHGASALPAVSMDDFKHQGGALTGREERHDRFEGCPPEQIAGPDHGHGSTNSSSVLPSTSHDSSSRGIGSSHDSSSRGIGSSHDSSSRGIGSSHDSSSRGIGSNGTTSNTASGTISDPSSGHSSGGPFNSHKHDPSLQSNTTGSSHTGHQHPVPASYGNDMHPEKTTGSSTHKPSMMDKLNPKVDANGDGKPGFMK